MTLRFEVLGRLIAADGAREAAIPRGHGRSILAALLAEPNRRVSVDDLVDALWGETPPRTASNTLQVHVGTLRRALRDASAALAARITTDGPGYRLRVEPGELDAEALAAAVAAARRSGGAEAAATADLLRTALGHWHGQPFEGVDARTPAVDAAAGRLEELRMTAVELLAELDLRLGHADEVARLLEAAIAEAPFRERLHALLMLALYRSGRQADALAAYQRVRARLGEELGIDPGPELRALELAILRHDPGLRGGRATLGEATEVPGDVLLPSSATRFVGREMELERFESRLTTERLITVVGVGGAGKTRFAIEAAARTATAFPGGVRFVDLGATTDGDRLRQAIAGAWSIAEQPGRALVDVIGAALGADRRLLLLDTCEHLVDPVAHTASRLLELAPGLTILATSREPLRLATELVWHLPPLGGIATDRSGPEDRSEALLADDAVRLFVARADRLRPERAWSQADLTTIATVCRGLDGLPLAIEMAAARSLVLTPADIAARLDDRLDLLASPDRDASARHRTLRATFDWSYELLGPAERETLANLSIFVRPASPAAVEAICRTAVTDDPTSVAVALAERSLVVAEIDGEGRSRFGLLDTVREYALGHLRAARAEDSAAGRHLAYWTAVAAKAYERRHAEADQQADALEAASDELRVALDRAHGRDPAGELRLAGLLGWFWSHHTHVREGRQILDRVLASTVDDDLSRARALGARGAIASAQGEATVAEADLTAALATWRELGDGVEVAATLDGLGWARFWAGDDGGSMAAFEDAVAAADQLGDPALIRRTRAGLGQVVVAVGDLGRAEPLAREMLRLAAGDLWTEHLAHHYLADCALMASDPATALEEYREALVLADRMGNGTETAIEVQGVAMSFAGLGDDRRAAMLDAAAAATLEALGVEINVPFWRALLARYVAPARAALATELPAIEAAGRALSLADAVAFSRASAPAPIV